MRIAINCRSFLLKNYTGVGRYTYNLVRSLSEIDKANEYWLYVQKKYFDFKRAIPRLPVENFSVKVDWFGQGISKTLNPVDIYHSPSLDFATIPNAKVVVTIHDLVYKMYPEGLTPQARETAEKQLAQIVAHADRIICCSQSTINDLKNHYPVKDAQVRLVYQGVDKNIFYPMNEQAKKHGRVDLVRKGIKDPFILFVGTVEPRKNLQNLILAFSVLKKNKTFGGKLVISGMKAWMIEGLEGVIKKFDLAQDVLFLGYMDDDTLRTLYNLCEVFVFPSFHEGFGYPIVEAFSCGAAVITSKVSSCPEIAADAAVTVDPYNPDEIAGAIARVLGDEKLKALLRARAANRANQFSFRKTAEETLAVYQDAML